ncbi:FAD-dependent oxidoreductase [Halodurantibacterium flavum]|uniref:FAD-dependent oxidoreductase n=1 Tax=Halodurantibacterium flavum TaxID=1382802 RepID=A0ABW4SBJ8_9RHOB
MRPVSVIGAGVAGLCVATALRARGMEIRLFDTRPDPGPQACSWWAGGMLAPWCESETAEEPVLRLGQRAADWWDRHAGGVVRNGTLVLALSRDRGDLARFARRTGGHRDVPASEIARLEPDLSMHRHGLLYAAEAHLNPRAALADLRRRLADADVPVETGTPPDGGWMIDCRGLAARDMLSDLRGVKGEMVVLRCPEITLSRPVRLLHPRHPLYIVPRGDGVFMLGATQIESADRHRLTARALLELLSAAYALHPAFAEAEVLETGVDARPAFADNLPRIRRRGQRIFINGLYRHGFLLAPALAEAVASYLTDGKRPEVMDEDRD